MRYNSYHIIGRQMNKLKNKQIYYTIEQQISIQNTCT